MKPQHRTRAILKSGLEASQKIILVAISDHMEDTEEGPDRNARPSVDLLCAETGLSERTLQGHIQTLIKAGILSRHQIPGHRTPHYLIDWGALPPQILRPR